TVFSTGRASARTGAASSTASTTCRRSSTTWRARAPTPSGDTTSAGWPRSATGKGVDEPAATAEAARRRPVRQPRRRDRPVSPAVDARRRAERDRLLDLAALRRRADDRADRRAAAGGVPRRGGGDGGGRASGRVRLVEPRRGNAPAPGADR